MSKNKDGARNNTLIVLGVYIENRTLLDKNNALFLSKLLNAWKWLPVSRLMLLRTHLAFGTNLH